MGKRKKTTPPTQNFVVEKILDSYVDELRNTWYLLKWWGYTTEEATWEPKDNVDCTGLINEYEHNKYISQTSTNIQWSLKQSGSSTKIVLRKVNHSVASFKVEPKPSDDHKRAHSSDTQTNGDCEVREDLTSLHKRQNKRRRSSTIGKQVTIPKKRKGRQAAKVVSTQPEEEYTVEAIIDKCLDHNGQILYLIKWVGYDHIYNTWEPVENLNCPAILYEFNKNNHIPKLIVSTILDKRTTDDKVEYLVKVSGCRKDAWMIETDLQCVELLREFNKEYDKRNSQKISLAEIADQYSSSDSDSYKPKPVVTKGIKINKNCTTSSDEDTLSPVVQKKKTFLLLNGHVKKASQIYSDSSSDSSNVDFEDLMRQYNESKKEDKTPTSPPSIDFDLKKETLSENKDARSPQSSPEQSPPHDTLSSEIMNLAKYSLPALVIPKEDHVEHKIPERVTKTSNNKLPKADLPKPLQIVKPEATEEAVSVPILIVQPDHDDHDDKDNASIASDDSGDSLSSLEKDLNDALESQTNENDSIDMLNKPPVEHDVTVKVEEPSDFGVVDLGALIMEPEKSFVNNSHSELLDAIVCQTVQGTSAFESLQSAILDTTTEKDISHSELFAVVAEHTDKPSEIEIDSVLGALYETTVSNESHNSHENVNHKPNPPEFSVLDDIITSLNDTKPSSSNSPASPPIRSFVSTFMTKTKKSFSAKKAKKVQPSISFDESYDDRDNIFADLGTRTKLPKKKSGGNLLPCQFCSKKFKDTSKLDFHISFKHPQMMEMVCDVCSQFFHSAVEYQCHQLTCGHDSE